MTNNESNVSSNNRWEFIEVFIDLEALKRNELSTKQVRREIVAPTEEDAHGAGHDDRASPAKPWELANTYVFPVAD